MLQNKGRKDKIIAPLDLGNIRNQNTISKAPEMVEILGGNVLNVVFNAITVLSDKMSEC